MDYKNNKRTLIEVLIESGSMKGKTIMVVSKGVRDIPLSADEREPVPEFVPDISVMRFFFFILDANYARGLIYI